MDGYEFILWLAGGLTALGVIISSIFKVHRYILKVDNLEIETKELEAKFKNKYEKTKLKIKELEMHHDNDMNLMKKEESHEFKEVQAEQQILMVAVLACLKALRDGNSNGDVDRAIEQVENHLIKKAHD